KHRAEKIREERPFIKAHAAELLKFFASGTEIDPSRIKPRLELVEADSVQSDLFRFASLTWSVPVSAGYGRRMRFLVWDDSNGKLMGLIALGDPVFNLGARDSSIGWTGEQRKA